MDYDKLARTLHPLERKIFPLIKDNSTLKHLMNESKLTEVEVTRALQWLENKELIQTKKEHEEIIELDKNGMLYLKNELPEKRFLKAIKKPLKLDEVKKSAKLDNDELNFTLGLLKKLKFIDVKNNISITESGIKYLNNNGAENLLKKLPCNIHNLSFTERNLLFELRRRNKIVKANFVKDIRVNLTEIGNKLKLHRLEHDLIESLTPEMLKTNSWQDKEFRHYDIKINVPKVYASKRHFVNQAVNYVRKIWLELGFKEMTGNILQTSFWNFDALFTPQDHPARDLQDTFFVKDPEKGDLPKIADDVKSIHESSYKYKWDPKEAIKNVLRTHNTVLSARTIANLKLDNLPVKYFAVGKVFRNETVDWSHLFEFIQTEGIVVSENVNFKHLLGYLKLFFNKMGFEKIKFRPVYFPFTEPSVEVVVYHPVKKIWIELGGAGVFRPEVVKPLLGKEIPVLAWGLGLERIITDYYGIKDLRDIYSNDIKKLREVKLWLK